MFNVCVQAVGGLTHGCTCACVLACTGSIGNVKRRWLGWLMMHMRRQAGINERPLRPPA